MLIKTEQVALSEAFSEDALAVFAPSEIPFISYPYEWCYSQLKEAALLTLTIQRRALERGFTLKDCSAFNVQFQGGAPVFIDSLSFQIYREGTPWHAYRQFCEHFLLPLALMRYRGLEAHRLLVGHVSGVPLDFGVPLLPKGAFLRPGLLAHLLLHARFQRKSNSSLLSPSTKNFPKRSFSNLLDHLEGTLSGLALPKSQSFWERYYEDELNYSGAAFEEKKRFVAEALARLKPKMVWDVGANTGVFSRVAAEKADYVVSGDLNSVCVERNFQALKGDSSSRVLPLILDLCNPSPAIGWSNRERASLSERGPADMVLALALVHHLAIGNNVPLPMIAEFFSKIARSLIIEFVPKDDSQVERMLSSRADIFTHYCVDAFELSFAQYFRITDRQKLAGSSRELFVMENIGLSEQ